MIEDALKNWLTLTLLALMCWSLWGVFANLTSRHLNSSSAVIWEVAGATIVALGVLIGVMHLQGLQRSPPGVAFGLLTGITYTIGLIFMFAALRAAASDDPAGSPSGHVHTILVVTAMYPLVSGLINRYALDEPLSTRQVVGMALGLGAVIIFVTGGGD